MPAGHNPRKDLIDDLKDSKFDIEFTGFEPLELDEMFSQPYDKYVKEDEFDVDEALKDPAVSKLWDIWLLGRHRLICGDSTAKETYDVLMDEKMANLVETDPPYNVAYEAKAGSMQNDDMKDSEFYKFLYNYLESSMRDLRQNQGYRLSLT